MKNKSNDYQEFNSKDGGENETDYDGCDEEDLYLPEGVLRTVRPRSSVFGQRDLFVENEKNVPSSSEKEKRV